MKKAFGIRFLGMAAACAAMLLASPAGARVVIHEILYHPGNGAVAAGENPEDLQFVELHNPGPGAADLSGWSFDAGVVHAFPAGTVLDEGAFLVVAANPSLLLLRGPAVPGGTMVQRWASGDLSNNGETVRLVDAALAVVDEVTYDDAGLWPAEADGGGASLELANPAFDGAYPLAWRASAGLSGTPGAPNSRFTEGPVVLQDVPARGSVVGTLDRVEVTFAEAVTGVAAGDLRVDGRAATALSCPSCSGGAGAGPWIFTGFGVPASNPAPVALGPGAIADLEGHPFAGETWAYFLSVPRVVINEIHYNPASSTDSEEFVELYNADTVAVDLTGWRLAEFGSPGCAFPAGRLLQPGAYAVCAKDPAALLAATGFATDLTWGLNDSLSNGGEPVALLNDAGTVVDRVAYGDAPPWPAGTGGPDGGGPSLELTNPFVDNGQAQFWRASPAANGTPGAVNGTYSEAPVVAQEWPARGDVVIDLPEVRVTFSEPVTGVTAGALEVNGVAALAVAGEGAGPYVFTVADPGLGAVAVVLDGVGIADLQGTPFAGDQWLYFYSLPRVVIHEIHYNPDAASVAAGEDPERLQFVELHNREAVPVDLSGHAIGEGLGMIFPAGTVVPAGGYLVLARDGAFLASKVALPAASPVLDWTDGDLANGGETLQLWDPYGRLLDQVTYDDRGEWTDGPDGKGPSLELIHPGLDNAAAGAWKASVAANGTPGAANSVFVENPSPIVFAPLHAPALPRGGQAVTVTASVLDDAGAPVSVRLFHRLDADPPGAYAAIPMADDGLHGDGAAGDGRYGAVLPGLADGQQWDFYIEASDGAGLTTAPAGHAVPDVYGQPSQTWLCKFSDEALPTDIPVYHVLVTLFNKHRQEALNTYPARKQGFDATFIDGAGNVWYNVVERFRGQSSLFKTPSSYAITFPSNRKLMSTLGFPVETLQLNAMRPMGQWLGYTLFNLAGLPAPRVGWARLRYTGINYDTCCTGQNSYYGAHVVVERYDDEFLDSQGGDVTPPRPTSSEGNLYRGRNDANLRWEGTDPATYFVGPTGQSGYEKYNNVAEDFWYDLLPLCDAVSNTPDDRYVDHVKAHVDEDNWAGYYALQALLGNREGGIYRDTGDDYFMYLPPPGDPHAPPHPDWGTDALPDDRYAGKSLMLPWDMDSIIWDANETIWRCNVPAPKRFLRHNAFAPVFVKAVEDLAGGVFSPAAMNALIDSMPDAVFGRSEGSDLWPETKAQFKAWVANRVSYALGQTVDDLTLQGVPESPYASADPVLHLSGTLQQAGTHGVTVNGVPATFSVFEGTWSFDLALEPGWNTILLQAWDRAGAEKGRIQKSVFHNPVGPWQWSIDLRAPRAMANDRTLTVAAAISDPIGRPDWQQWNEVGRVSVVRLPDRTPVAITPTVFDTHQEVPDDGIRFVNGWGSVSFTLDEGAAFAPGVIEVTVDWNGLKASRRVTVLKDPAHRVVSGTLTGADLVWGPDEAIRVAGNCTVPEGSTLTILPGTIVQVDTTGTLENGTLLVVNGSLQALGTKDLPIFFYSERGPAAMRLTQSGSASNGDAWRGFQFYGTGSSTMRHVFLTGAGNGNVVSHPRPPILGLFNTHGLLADRCVFADNNGMVFSGQGTGSYTVRKTLVQRAGIGAEFFGNGHTLLIRDSWWTGCGRAPEANNLDGDLLHVDGALSSQIIRSSILNDSGDDGIDHSASNFRVEHTIITNIRDKSVSMTGGSVDAWNVLMFRNGSGIRGRARANYATIATASPVATVESVRTSIVWPSSIPTCTGAVDYTDVGNPADLGCGTGNLSTNPLWEDPAGNDYDPRAGSPALTAGPNQDRIGWLGFPYGAVCATTADCNDTNACTTDTCVDKLCVFTPVVGCLPCDIDEDCDDGNPCTTDTCAPDGACGHAVRPDGSACDDRKGCTSPDTCTAGTCGGPESCPPGHQCDGLGACALTTFTVTFQQGVDGYAGTRDTYLDESQPDAALGALATWRWDLDAPGRQYGLIRFDDVFGPQAGRIPQGSTVVRAVLALNVEDPGSLPAARVHEAAADWDPATATFNGFGGEPGVDGDEVGAAAGDAPVDLGVGRVDVTASLAAWASAPAANRGWVFLPNGDDGVAVTASESGAVALRPALLVTYAPPVASCTADDQCDDGRFCNGAETCNPANLTCRAGTPPSCDDGVACTADACDPAANACTHAPSAVRCDDGNLCTDDTCDAALGCRHADNTAPCSDGDACTEGDACAGGACAPGAARTCDDGLACTADACDPALGCVAADLCPAGQACDGTTGTCEAGPTTVVFQQGLDGYAGTVDTYLSAGAPDTSNATATPVVVDGDVPPEEERQILLRFDDVFGDAPGRVPQGARILSATLTLYVTNPSSDGATLHRVLVPWTDADTWNGTGGGMALDGVEARAEPDASGATNSNRAPYDVDVTASLVAWSGGQGNRGWVFVTPPGGTDSWQVASSDDDVAEQRPMLTVVFVPCDPGYAGDGVSCFDVDECGGGTGPCDAHATCTNLEGSYACACLEGFTGDGHACQDVDECAAEPAPCDAHATCTNQPGTFQCACDAGFTGDGRTCADVDECAAVPGPCDPHATCSNGPGTFECACDAGYVGDGTACGECPGGAADPCHGRGTCGGTALEPACLCDGGFAAPDCGDCRAGLFGAACDRACAGGADLPCNGHGACDDGLAGTGACTCDAGFAGDACEACAEGWTGWPDCTNCAACVDMNPCTTESCSPETGCLHEPNTLPCEDGNACTANDTCANRACVGTPVDCDDGDPCTADSCDRNLGCLHGAVAGCCRDDAACAPPGRCLARACDPGTHACGALAALPGCCETFRDCDDGVEATVDDCDVATGTCTNGDPCGDDEGCDDGDPCTDDSCDGETGRCRHDAVPGCGGDAGDAGCDGGDCGGGGDVPVPDPAGDLPGTDAPDVPDLPGDVPADLPGDLPGTDPGDLPAEAGEDVPAQDAGGEAGEDLPATDVATDAPGIDAPPADTTGPTFRAKGGGCSSTAGGPGGAAALLLAGLLLAVRGLRRRGAGA